MCQLSISQVHLDFWSSQLQVGSCIASNPDFCHRLGSNPSWLGAMRPTSKNSGWIEAIKHADLKESGLDNKVIWAGLRRSGRPQRAQQCKLNTSWHSISFQTFFKLSSTSHWVFSICNHYWANRPVG